VRALVVLVLALSFLAGCGGGDSGGGSPGSGGDTPDAAAKRFLDRYVQGDGRVSRIDEGGDTVGEGQAYGMLIAAASGDSQRFDQIWNWTKQNLRRPDGLISFKWRDGKIEDPQAASDADVDAARALLVASCRFKRPAQRQEGIDLGKAILDKETSESQGKPVLTAGPWANKEPQTINPSYFSPATFADLGTASGDGEWGSLSASSREITGALMTDSSPLPPDWAKLEGGKPVPIGTPDDPGGAPKFSFDAPRTLVRMAEDPDQAGRAIAARAWPVFEGQDPNKIVVERDLTGKPVGGSMHPVVLVAAAAAADAAGKDGDRDKLLDAATAMDQRSSTYFGSAWVALGRYMLTTDALKTC
jgi:endo-1,4-beta-D-glucanase Y